MTTISTDDLIAVFPQASQACKMELHNLVLQRRIAQLEEEVATLQGAIAVHEAAVKGTT